jgi:hypothetical protein
MNWILSFLGIAINFLSKYNCRTAKESFSVKFWIKDNWVELVQSTLWIVAIMLLLCQSDFDTEAFYKWLSGIVPIPKGVIAPVQLVVPFLTGLSINHIVYWYNKKYIKKK